MTIHSVCAVQIPTAMPADLFNELVVHMPNDRRERTLRFVKKEDAYRSLFSEMLIKTQIQKLIGIPIEAIQMDKNKYGKPYIKGCDNLHFNVSHSGLWVVAALSECAVGIDIEEKKAFDFLAIGERFFAAEEIQALLHASDQLDYFYLIWTMKESLIKHVGMGLSLPLNAFSIRTDSENGSFTFYEDECYWFQPYAIHDDYKMAVCYKDGTGLPPQKVAVLDTGELITSFLNSVRS